MRSTLTAAHDTAESPPDELVELIGSWRRHLRAHDWQRHRAYARGVRRLAHRLPVLWGGTILDGELEADRFASTIARLAREGLARLRTPASRPSWPSSRSMASRRGHGGRCRPRS